MLVVGCQKGTLQKWFQRRRLKNMGTDGGLGIHSHSIWLLG